MNINEILDDIKLEDFEDGIKAEEKHNLAKDLTVIHNVLQNHDSSIFQLIAGANALQKIIMNKLDISEEELIEYIQVELDYIQEQFQEKISKQDKSETSED